MSESTDPQLAGQCGHCGKFYTRRHFTNQHGQRAFGRIVPSKYCSPECRYAAAKARHAPTATDDRVACVPPPTDFPAASTGPLKSDLYPGDAFERVRGGLSLSDWKPDPRAKPEDVPDIPEFLKR